MKISPFHRLRCMRHNPSMLRAILCFLLPVALISAGCNDSDGTVGGEKREKQYQSIISLSPSTTELLLTQGSNQWVKGRTEACNFPEAVVRNIPVVASLKPDYEKIASMKPDLVVYDEGLYNESDVARIKEIGADTFVVDANTVDDFIQQLYKLGSLVGTESNYSTYIDKIVAARTSSEGNPIEPKPRAAILLSGYGGTEHMIAGKGSFTADVVKASGAEVVGPDSDKFERLSPEQILTENPTVIIVGVTAKDPAATEKQVSAILNDPRLKATDAVKNRRILPLDQDALLRRGSRVDRLIDRLHKLLAERGV